MKKLSSMLTLGLAMAMVFGMTVSAAGSVSTVNSSVTNDTLKAAADSVVAESSVAVDVKEVDVAVFDNAAVTAPDAEVVGKGAETKIVTAFDVEVAEAITSSVTITFKNVEGVSAGKQYVALHQLKDGAWETLPAKVVGAGSIEITFNSLSPVAIVEVVKAGEMDDDDDDDDDEEAAVVVAADGTVVAPKTGEALPAAGILAVICLAGAALCAKKVRFNN